MSLSPLVPLPACGERMPEGQVRGRAQRACFAIAPVPPPAVLPSPLRYLRETNGENRMSDGAASLLQLSLPWYQFVLRAVAVYFVVMVLVRLSGKRAVGQFTPFDLVLLIL